MNLSLQKEILKHIMKRFGILLKENEIQFGFMGNMLDDKFLINKKLAFVSEDKKEYQNNVWAAVAKTGPSKLRILVADIHEDIPEFTIIFQMDSLPVYALRLSSDDNDFGSAYLNTKDSEWIEASTSIQAKFLFGVEGLSEMPLRWEKLDTYEDMYKFLIQFLNFYERE